MSRATLWLPSKDWRKVIGEVDFKQVGGVAKVLDVLFPIGAQNRRIGKRTSHRRASSS